MPEAVAEAGLQSQCMTVTFGVLVSGNWRKDLEKHLEEGEGKMRRRQAKKVAPGGHCLLDTAFSH